jgi:cysteine-rich repeat protein
VIRVIPVLMLVTLAGCSFDSTALSSRACSSDDECAGGICISGYCQTPSLDLDGGGTIDGSVPDGDTGGVDLDADPGDADAGDGADSDGGADAEPPPCDGTPRCEGATVVQCTDDVVVVVQDCDDDATCTAAAGCTCESGACVSRICVPGSTRCSVDGGVETCFADGLAWSAGVACDDGERCLDGACASDACEPGTTACVGNTIVVCDDDGAIANSRDCETSATVCDDRGEAVVCTAPVCEPGTVRCGGPSVGEDADGRFECDERGLEELALAACGAGQRCEAGACVAEACEPGTESCVDDFTEGTCDSAGSSVVLTPCEAGFYCDPASADCTEQICEPGEARCFNPTALETCNARGSDFGIPTPCADGTACVAGVCTDRICSPGSRTCNDEGDVAVCNETGTAIASTVTCEFVCTDGECQPSRCGDGIVDSARGETCDDANTIACDSCDACQVRNVLSAGPPLVTSSNTARWVPGESDLTIEMWLRTTATDGTLAGIGDTNERDFVLARVINGLPVLQIRLDGTDSEILVVGGQLVNTGSWVHVAFVRFGRDGGKVFVNGELVGINRREQDARSIDDTVGRVWLASEGRIPALAAELDEVRISSTARYVDRFLPRLRYAADSSTIALWHLDTTTGGAVADESGARNLTLSAGTWLPQTCAGAPTNTVNCGDGLAAPWEGCDDGDLDNGDGCSSACRVERRCPIGVERPGATEGGCYFPILQGMPWDQARRTCNTFGGTNLATVNNAAENAWIQTTYRVALWIGFNDRDDFIGNGPFEWAAGSSGYTNWASGEPNDGGAFDREDCTELLPSGQWNDRNCDTALLAICEYPF